MGLVSKTAKVKWHPRAKKHYESLGYIFTKYGDEFEVKIEDLTKGSQVKVDCLCDNCGYDLMPTYNNYNKYVKEDGKIYCNEGAKKLYGGENIRKAKLKDGKSFYDWCVKNNRQDILDRWDYKNGCSPKDVSYSTNKKMWFKCDRHPEHKSELKSINRFVNGQEGSIKCKQCNSIAQYIIDKYGKDFLLKIWSDKNKTSPFKVSIYSKEKIWWKCLKSKHEDYQRTCANAVVEEFRCYNCSKEKEESIIEEKTRLYLEELGYEVKTEHNCTIRPINPKTRRPLPFDNEIVLENGKHLIIEVHGEQHYGSSYFITRKKMTKEEAEKYLHYQQIKDRYKRIICKKADYEYLEIPCTAFNKKETYKKLIDNKIKEILNRR